MKRWFRYQLDFLMFFVFIRPFCSYAIASFHYIDLSTLLIFLCTRSVEASMLQDMLCANSYKVEAQFLWEGVCCTVWLHLWVNSEILIWVYFRMQDKTIAYVGDSLGRQMFQSMMCMVTGGTLEAAVITQTLWPREVAFTSTILRMVMPRVQWEEPGSM